MFFRKLQKNNDKFVMTTYFCKCKQLRKEVKVNLKLKNTIIIKTSSLVFS